MTLPTDRAWEIIEKVGICMLTTRTSKGEFRSRPVEARPCRDEGSSAAYPGRSGFLLKRHLRARGPGVTGTLLNSFFA